MNEQSKSHNARLRNGDYRFLRGNVLDIGCGPDPIKLPPPAVVTGWDLKDGDAQYLETLKDEAFDAVVSSHCLEHMVSVPVSLKNWARVLKTGGYMSISVPSWLAYERYQWPSRYNGDHKSSFDLIDPPVRPYHNFYTFRDMRRIGLEVGLTLEDARMEIDNYDLSRTWDKNFDQTRGSALAQVTFIYFKH
jgi:predicted SAM-dependent methyltransferase